MREGQSWGMEGRGKEEQEEEEKKKEEGGRGKGHTGCGYEEEEGDVVVQVGHCGIRGEWTDKVES